MEVSVCTVAVLLAYALCVANGQHNRGNARNSILLRFVFLIVFTLLKVLLLLRVFCSSVKYGFVCRRMLDGCKFIAFFLIYASFVLFNTKGRVLSCFIANRVT